MKHREWLALANERRARRWAVWYPLVAVLLGAHAYIIGGVYPRLAVWGVATRVRQRKSP